MILKIIYMFLVGSVRIKVEGFFIERFLNICRSQNIFIQDLQRKNSTYIVLRILKDDFKKIKNIAKKTKCKIKIERKYGVPFFLNKYRKRKIFAVAILVIAIFIFILTKFIWNVEIVGNKEIDINELKELVAEYGIEEGKLKSDINIDKISNLIRLRRNDISWVGITIKGTNVIISVEEVTKIPEIIDENEICNIIATEDAVISKIIVQNGTARVNVGDEVKKGDLLVEGVMEGKYLGNRYVHAEATVFGKIFYEKEKKESLVQNEKIKTGEISKNKVFSCLNYELNNYFYNNKLYNDLIDFDIIEYYYIIDKTINNKLYIDLEFKIREYYLINNNIEKKTKKLRVRMKHNETEKEIKSHNIIKCKNCGASIDATNKECEYCKTKYPKISEWYIEKLADIDFSTKI